MVVVFDASQCVDVEAESKEDAEVRAMIQAYASLCHQCAGVLDLGEPIEVVEVLEIDD